MPADYLLIITALSTVITTLVGVIAWGYKDGMKRADERVRAVEEQRDTLLREFAAILRPMAATVESIVDRLEPISEYVADLQAEARVEARQQAKRQLPP